MRDRRTSRCPYDQVRKDVQFVVLAVIAAAIWCTPARGYAQEGQPPTLRIGMLPDGIAIDGVLNEPAWEIAEGADAFAQTDPADQSSTARW